MDISMDIHIHGKPAYFMVNKVLCDKHYSHRQEFSETCLEYQGNVREFLLVVWWELCLVILVQLY